MELPEVIRLIACDENHGNRRIDKIAYVVMHYTGNVNDTAKNNAVYFHENEVGSSAHYFVDDTSIYQSVPDEYVAWAVGLGARKEPYFLYPPMWNVVTNSNSISIEMCGSKNSTTASEKTKDNACKLAAYLMHKHNIPTHNICRHFDVTGKECPRWAVHNNAAWEDIKKRVEKYYKGEEDIMDQDTFDTMMEKYLAKRAALPTTWETDAMQYCAARGLINDGKPKSFITRGELATILKRMNA